MRLVETLREAGRNLDTGMTRPMALTLLFACILAFCAGMDMRQVADIENRTQGYRSALSNVQLIKKEGAVDPAACNALTGNTGVGESGALRKGNAIKPLLAPGFTINTYEVTQPFLGIVQGEGRGTGGLWVSSAVADKLGLHPGTTLETTEGEMTVDGVYRWPEDGRDTRLGYSALVPVIPDGDFDECWASIWPLRDDVTATLRQSLKFSTDLSDSQTGQINYSQGDQFDPHALFETRLTRPLIYAPALLCFLTAILACRRRRLEIAGYLHAREPKISMMVRMTLEHSACLLLAMSLTVPLLVTAFLVKGADLTDLTRTSLVPVLLTALLGQVAGSLAGAGGIRERDLFRHFKNRE